MGRVHKDGANFYQFTSSGWQLMDSIEGYGPDQGYIDVVGYPLAVGDFNGDGRTDIGRVWWSGVGFLANSSPPPDLMSTVASPLGGVTTLYYTPSSRYSNTLLPFVLQTLYYLYNDDGRGNVSGTSFYLSGGLYKHADRDFRGFGYTVATRWNSVPAEESHTETLYLSVVLLTRAPPPLSCWVS